MKYISATLKVIYNSAGFWLLLGDKLRTYNILSNQDLTMQELVNAERLSWVYIAIGFGVISLIRIYSEIKK